MEKGKHAQTRPAFWVGIAIVVLALAGPILFALVWWHGDQSLFVINGSYVVGAIVLFGLAVVALLGQRQAQRLGGPAIGLATVGLLQVIGLLLPMVQPYVFKLSFLWYLNVLYAFPTFHGIAKAISWLRQKLLMSDLDRPGRIAVLNGLLTLLWLVVIGCLGWRVYEDRLSGLIVGLWPHGWPMRALLFAVVAILLAPLAYWRTGPRRPRANPRDAGLEVRLRRLAYGGTAIAVVFAGAALTPAPAWAEMPDDRILVEVQSGSATIGGGAGGSTLVRGDRRYLSPNNTVSVAPDAWARLVFRGGSDLILCGSSALTISTQSTAGVRPATPVVRLSLAQGRVLADTASRAPGYGPLRLTIEAHGEISYNDGAAQFSVQQGGAELVSGRVSHQGEWLAVTGNSVSCAGPRPPGSPAPPGAS